MPIRPLLVGAGVFSPQDVTAMTMAFEDALLVLHLDRDDPAAAAMAKRIIELAEHGERLFCVAVAAPLDTALADIFGSCVIGC